MHYQALKQVVIAHGLCQLVTPRAVHTMNVRTRCISLAATARHNLWHRHD